MTFQKWLIKLQKEIKYHIEFDYPPYKICTTTNDITDMDKGHIFEFNDLFMGLNFQLLTLEVGCACDIETLRGFSDLTRRYLERATEHDNSLVPLIECE